ncbi:hypothetical protein ILYODFUR_038595 [Ilyodon furcidens]|uniref:Uncharacterized protein n=1 Tax=Ilyodon furcidens TaxID=33524 RepID=A0ABV0UN01_9TELE
MFHCGDGVFKVMYSVGVAPHMAFRSKSSLIGASPSTCLGVHTFPPWFVTKSKLSLLWLFFSTMVNFVPLFHKGQICGANGFPVVRLFHMSWASLELLQSYHEPFGWLFD